MLIDCGSDIRFSLYTAGFSHLDITDLDTYFNVQKIGHEQIFTWEEITFKLVRVIHVDNGYFTIPSYGLFFEVAGIKIFLTTDTTLCLDYIEKYYQQGDIIFQDCETSEYPTSVHANYKELLSLPKSIKNKMWLYGYQPGDLKDARQDRFCGFVKRGQGFALSQDGICQTDNTKVA